MALTLTDDGTLRQACRVRDVLKRYGATADLATMDTPEAAAMRELALQVTGVEPMGDGSHLWQVVADMLPAD